jgi:hypothetical protein
MFNYSSVVLDVNHLVTFDVRRNVENIIMVVLFVCDSFQSISCVTLTGQDGNLQFKVLVARFPAR